MQSFVPYKSRPIRYLGQVRHGDWAVKRYSIVHGPAPLDDLRFQAAEDMGFSALPNPAHAEGRSALAFVILHQGRGADYLIMAWWDRENELPLRVFVRDASGRWRPAQGSESVCVWDLQIIAAERDAYVETMLSERGPQREEYLARRLHRARAMP